MFNGPDNIIFIIGDLIHVEHLDRMNRGTASIQQITSVEPLSDIRGTGRLIAYCRPTAQILASSFAGMTLPVLMPRATQHFGVLDHETQEISIMAEVPGVIRVRKASPDELPRCVQKRLSNRK